MRSAWDCHLIHGNDISLLSTAAMKCLHWSLFCQKLLSENVWANFTSTFCKRTSFQSAFFNADEFSLGPVFLIQISIVYAGVIHGGRLKVIRLRSFIIWKFAEGIFFNTTRRDWGYCNERALTYRFIVRWGKAFCRQLTSSDAQASRLVAVDPLVAVLFCKGGHGNGVIRRWLQPFDCTL